MSWKSGSSIVSEIIGSVKEHLDDVDFSVRVAFFQDLIGIFESADWDSVHDVIGEDAAFDEAAANLYPELFEDEEEAVDDDGE